MAQPGYVTADGASTTILGWNVGEPTIWRTRDVVLDRRVWFGKPARWPAHRCEACGLVMFQFFVEERWRGSPAARPSHNPRRDDVPDRRGGVTVSLFSRFSRRSRTSRLERPPRRCLRCGETALPGYVMTPG
ncbi:MAG: hypothetical protein C0P77_007245, partial [Thermoanaerobacterales bacterium]